jgi:hypothetical protein
MDVPDRRQRRRSAHRRAITLSGLQQAREIDGIGRHLDLPVLPAPCAARPVAVHLESVAVGVGEIERLTDQVIALAHRNACGNHPLERTAEIRLRGQQDRDVVEPGRPRGDRLRARYGA